MYRVDQAVQAWFGHVRQPAVTVLFLAATNLGGTSGLATLVSMVNGHAMSSFITFGAPIRPAGGLRRRAASRSGGRRRRDGQVPAAGEVEHLEERVAVRVARRERR